MTTWLKAIPLTPVVVGAAFYALSFGPDSVREPLLHKLQAYLSPQQIKDLAKTLKWLFIIDSTRYANGLLNELALNNYQSEPSGKWKWSEEIAVISGAASGFGKLFTQDLTAKGIHVVALDISDAPQDLLSNKLVTFIKCDVTSIDAVRETAKKIQDTVGHPSILINNAGIARNHTILDTSPEDLDKIVGVNLLSHYYMVQQFLPNMIERKKGHIITIASMASFIAQPFMTDYCVTKAGVMAFHEGLTSEIRGAHGCPEIKTTIVHPLWAATAMVAPHANQLKQGGQKIMDPQDVSNAVVDQIINRRSGKLVIGQGTNLIKRFRYYPDWITWIIRRGMEKKMKLVATPETKIK
ncbi:hypothetical protein CAC42_2268 [Sphaceloma murrayae]|uniref:Short-chain dehydrogenase/reductase 3 n=1 Tax=Sphaceloma murrayae TaxID=2082308 RepID=A0A2K1QJH4_9PEZI|nr:hypothetical protein CAC42_2268 [Sphaceloma murrayae]